MATRVFVLLLTVGFLTACTAKSITPISNSLATETSIPSLVPSTAASQSASSMVEEHQVSYRVAAFYYPWYGNPTIDGQWTHWTQNNHFPPDDIASDYYPVLGPYSSNDPAVLDQHMEWLRQAGVGVIITSWWGQGSREDQAVPRLLQAAEKYGIKVAFHIEPYNGRTAERLVSDIQYLYSQYGHSPAFFRSTASSRYSPSREPKGMFFVWSIGVKGAENKAVQSNYWRQTMDLIHALPESALIIANTLESNWVRDSHFDGLYNYASLHMEENGGFDWARSLPPDSLYVPSVLPGFAAKRVGYASNTYVSREDGLTFDQQWTSALGTGVEPAMVTITSFNEWHEGSMIEPAQAGVRDQNGYTYADFGSLSPEGYLARTRDWVDKYLAVRWPTTYRARIKLITTSDWTTLDIIKGGAWLKPERVSASTSVITADLEAGGRLILIQSLEDANAGKEVEMVWDVWLTGLVPGQDLTLQVERGSIGKTQVVIYNYTGSEPIEVRTLEWDQVTTGRNSYPMTIPADRLMAANP